MTQNNDSPQKCPVCKGDLEPDSDYPNDLLCGKCEKVFDRETMVFVESFRDPDQPSVSPVGGCKGNNLDPPVCQNCLPGYQRVGCTCPEPKRKYRVMCVTWYEEVANNGEEAKAIIQENLPEIFQYMRAERIA
jgi:hypothetical protein